MMKLLVLLYLFAAIVTYLDADDDNDPRSKEKSKEGSRCHRHEQLNQCGDRCDLTCLYVLAKRSPICFDICDPPACVCKKNYARNEDKKCIPESECSNENTCPEHEVVNGCGAYCELKCSDVISGHPPICPLICGPPACVCGKGYARSKNKKCIPEGECRHEG